MTADMKRRSFLAYSAATSAFAGQMGVFPDIQAAEEHPVTTSIFTVSYKETSIETNKRLAREYYKAIDQGGPGAGKDYIGPNALYHGANHSGFENLTPAGLGKAFYTAFPDFTHIILDQVAEGDFVVERIRYFATHLGEFMGIPATGRPITFTGMDWVRFENGKAVERWGVASEFDLRRQLLGLPDPVQPQTDKALAHEYYEVIDREGPAVGAPYGGKVELYHGANHTGFNAKSPADMGRLFYTAFPDFTHVIMDQVAEGDIVVERIRYFATHRGEFMGIPATGKRITFTGMDWVRFANGRIVERWGVASEYDLRRQLLGEPNPRPEQTKAILASDLAFVTGRFGKSAGKPFERLDSPAP
jgi:predicted ester cyclase